MRVLIVDDSRAMRAILRKILMEIGCEVTEAGDGKEALSVLSHDGRTDLALVDWNMPEMDGFEFLKVIRANQAFEGLRVVMVTTETDLLQVTKALEAGADEYIMKPFSKEAVVEKINALGIAQQ